MGEWIGTSIWESDLRVLVGPQLKNQSVPLCFSLSLENLGGRPVDLSGGQTAGLWSHSACGNECLGWGGGVSGFLKLL